MWTMPQKGEWCITTNTPYVVLLVVLVVLVVVLVVLVVVCCPTHLQLIRRLRRRDDFRQVQHRHRCGKRSENRSKLTIRSNQKLAK